MPDPVKTDTATHDDPLRAEITAIETEINERKVKTDEINEKRKELRAAKRDLGKGAVGADDETAMEIGRKVIKIEAALDKLNEQSRDNFAQITKLEDKLLDKYRVMATGGTLFGDGRRGPASTEAGTGGGQS